MESEREAGLGSGPPLPADNRPLGPGDAVFHPKYGFGTIDSLTRRDRIHPIHEPSAADAASDRTEAYYDIHLVEGGSLLVPVSRAESVGLRRLTNGLAAVRACLCSPPQGLPANARERAAVLRSREQLAEPEALADSVRDMLAQSRDRTLSTTERTWLDRACQRLSMEIALVDHISLPAARAAFWEAVAQSGSGDILHKAGQAGPSFSSKSRDEGGRIA